MRRGLTAAAVGLLVATGTACAGGKPAAGGSSQSGSDDSSKTGDVSDIKFAACMRDNGVSVVDPKPGEAPRIPAGVPQAELDKAEKACGKNPGSGQAGSGTEAQKKAGNDPVVEGLRLKAMACMSKNGYEPPKPNSGGAVSLNADDPVRKSAQKACKAEWDAYDSKFNELVKKG
ncbi:hypothetical protein ACFQ78_39915 [Streptomyces sp. NPDC056519]|uniref:hypothetical protein n=1 Tax=Streptomyces sp. NPDC056519 TaxID=3345849 RepID=UPI0036A84BBB